MSQPPPPEVDLEAENQRLKAELRTAQRQIALLQVKNAALQEAQRSLGARAARGDAELQRAQQLYEQAKLLRLQAERTAARWEKEREAMAAHVRDRTTEIRELQEYVEHGTVNKKRKIEQDI